MYGKVFLPVTSTRTSFLPGCNTVSASANSSVSASDAPAGKASFAASLSPTYSRNSPPSAVRLLAVVYAISAFSARIVDCVEPKPP